MKKIYSFLAALLVMLTIAPGVRAEFVIGSAVALEDIVDGMEVAFEARSCVANRGKYLPYYNYKTYSGVSCCVDYTRGDEVPAALIWKLVRAEAPNAVTGQDEYYLLNKESDTYLSMDWSLGEAYPQSRISMVTSKDKASKFCFNSSNAGGQYGSADYGNGLVDWVGDGSAVTIAEIRSDIHNGRGYLANEFATNNTDGAVTFRGFSVWMDTNVWTVHRYVDLSDPREKLVDLINQLPASVEDDYKYGTDPGYIADKAKYEDFVSTLMKAIEGVDTMSDDECEATYQKLNELLSFMASEESAVSIEDGGYYYFFTGYNAFWEVDNGNFAIYAPHDKFNDVIGWKAFNENDPKFIWQITKVETEDGLRYAIRNVATGVYFNKARSKANSQQVLWSTELVNPTILRSFNHAGQWYVSDDADQVYPPRPFHMAGHNNGGGTSGELVLWDGGANSPSSWFIKKVPQEKVDQLANMQGYIELNKTYTLNRGLITRSYVVKDAPGYISKQELIDNYKAVEAEVDTMLNYSEGKVYTDAEYAEAGKKLLAASEAFVENMNRPMTDGYYRIQLNHWFALKNDNNYYLSTLNGQPGWKRTPVATTEQIWKITSLGNNKYTVQNMANGKYLGKALAAANGSPVQFTDAAEVAQVIKPFPEMVGQLYMSNESDSTFCYDDWGHDEGTATSYNICYWAGKGLNGGTAWAFVPVSEEEYAAIQAGNDKQMLMYELGDALKVAKRTFNNNTVYTYGDKIITEADQLYSNNSDVREGTNLGLLIDGNNGTIWHSAWNTENEDATHYLRYETRDEAGLPDSIALYYVQRAGQFRKTPSKMRVSVSNDAETWTYFPQLIEKADMGNFDIAQDTQAPRHTIVTGLKGYKYVRFEFLATKPHDTDTNLHPFVNFAEVNLLPITGIDAENSVSQQPAAKAFYQAIYDAIQKGNAEYVAGAPTQATIDLIKQAVADVNNKGVVDSVISMAKNNVNYFTAGTQVGEFDADALDAYKTAAQKTLDEFETLGAAAKPADYTKAGKELTAAYEALIPTMVLPEKGKWYYIETNDPERTGHIIAACDQYATTPGTDSWTAYGTEKTKEDAGESVYAHFRFNVQEDGTYEFQNVGTGYFLGPEKGCGYDAFDGRALLWYLPDHHVKFIPFGGGQVGIQIEGGHYFRANPSWRAERIAFEEFDGTQSFNSPFAWTLHLTSEEFDVVNDYEGIAQGRAMPITKPYDLKGAPESDEGPFFPHKVVGIVYDEEDNSVVKAINLQQYDLEEVIPAGTPVVYVATEKEFNGDIYYTGKYEAIVDATVTCFPDTVNGFVGNLDAGFTMNVQTAYPSKDGLIVYNPVTWLYPQRGYIVPQLVENIEGAQIDRVLYVSGTLINGVENVVVENAKALVNVYSIDGVLVRRNVERINATNGLAKGIYIVGKEKVLVK